MSDRDSALAASSSRSPVAPPAAPPAPAAPAALVPLALLALLCFAGNSWLCRAALRAREIDPASFTAIRLTGGAAMLALLVSLQPKGERSGGSFASALALSVYAIAFSLAYLRLDAGLGALVLFGAVQLTMLGGALAGGSGVNVRQGAGMALALAGLALLGLPGASAPPPLAALGMAAAGMAWAIYSLRGRRERASPLAANAGNFLRALPLALLPLLVQALGPGLQASRRGAVLALLSGTLTSGLGYAVWYRVLPGLSALTAGLVQLAVPVVAAAGGIALFGERLTPRLVAAGLLVLAGVALPLVRRRAG